MRERKRDSRFSTRARARKGGKTARISLLQKPWNSSLSDSGDVCERYIAGAFCSSEGCMWVGLATIGPGRTGASRRTSRAAVHGCSRVIMQVLPPVASPVTADRCWVLTVAGVDSRAHLPFPDAMGRRRTAANLLYHAEYDFRRVTKRRGPPFRPVARPRLVSYPRTH